MNRAVCVLSNGKRSTVAINFNDIETEKYEVEADLVGYSIFIILTNKSAIEKNKFVTRLLGKEYRGPIIFLNGYMNERDEFVPRSIDLREFNELVNVQISIPN